jgi:hypothetical protein
MERRKKVLCPIEGRDGKKFWMRVGNAWINKDGSMNVWLSAYPVNGGQLQIRDLDENDLARREESAARREAPEPRDELPLLKDSSSIPF